MVKSEIISKLSEKIHQKIKKSELEKIINIILNSIVKEIKNDRACEIRKYFRFYPKKIKARIVRNPRTGEKIPSEEKLSIGFKMTKELKEKINENRTTN